MTEHSSPVNAAPLPLWQQLQFDLLLGKLSDWRNADHEDAVAICRSDVIAILDGVKALRSFPHAQQTTDPVQDTWLVGGPDLKAMSGSVESDRVIQLHFRRPVTDKDREWLLEAINAKIASGPALTSPGCRVGNLFPDIGSQEPDVICDADDIQPRQMRDAVIEECAKIAKNYYQTEVSSRILRANIEAIGGNIAKAISALAHTRPSGNTP